MLMRMNARSIVLSTAALVSTSAIAQESAPAQAPGQPPAWQDMQVPPTVQASVNYTYDAPGTAKFNGANLSSSYASALTFGADTRIELQNGWFVPLGLRSDNYWLDSVAGAPIPDQINTLNLRSGLGWRMNDEWTFTGVAGPILYRFDDIHGDDLGAFGAFMATWHYRPDLAWTFGVMVVPDNDVPVLPVAGVRWDINDAYSLEVGIPRTRLTYHVDSQWSLYTGLDMNGTVFRTDENLGTRTGFPQYNNQLATYRDIRLGVGTGYEIIPGLRAEAEVGYSVYRHINYKEINQDVEFDPSPYVHVGLSYRF